MKNLDNEKIANCCLQVFYLLQCFLFKGYLDNEAEK